ncbi:hypothetical protein N2W52_001968 [Clostridium perfringens]|nr:hypothetical protein [Clostridium perfringens]MDK0982985.1 hypothetical protein [Clostridium perfringens]
MKFVEIIIAVVCILIFIITYLYLKHREKLRWNNGVCPECGEPWGHVYTDSQGGRLYRCKNYHDCSINYSADGDKPVFGDSGIFIIMLMSLFLLLLIQVGLL